MCARRCAPGEEPGAVPFYWVYLQGKSEEEEITNPAPRKYPMAIFVKLTMDSTSEGIQWNRILALSLISIIPQLLLKGNHLL